MGLRFEPFSRAYSDHVRLILSAISGQVEFLHVAFIHRHHGDWLMTSTTISTLAGVQLLDELKWIWFTCGEVRFLRRVFQNDSF